MKVLVQKWGNCAAVRIPASVMEAAHLSLDHPVDIREEDGRIILDPERSEMYSIEELVNGITTSNQHRPVDSGPAVGREVW